jgi:uncharacterized protein YigE (DUF2233 family)
MARTTDSPFAVALAVAVTLGGSGAARAADCARERHGGREYTTCRVDLARESLRVFYADEQGTRYEGFAALDRRLARAGRTLELAVNGGMFHPDMRPVGLLVIDGREIAPIERRGGFGNFYLRPNGVFLVDHGGARVLATDEYRGLAPRFATQSGPMLVHRGLIPDLPAFRAGSRSRFIRNGVCAPHPARATFVISEEPVSFREFARYFLEVLGCTEALYLDGSISSLHVRALGRSDARARLGPIIAVVGEE